MDCMGIPEEHSPTWHGGRLEKAPPRERPPIWGQNTLVLSLPCFAQALLWGGWRGDGRALLMAGGCGCGTGCGVTKGRDNGPRGAAAQLGG